MPYKIYWSSTQILDNHTQPTGEKAVTTLHHLSQALSHNSSIRSGDIILTSHLLKILSQEKYITSVPPKNRNEYFKVVLHYVCVHIKYHNDQYHKLTIVSIR